MRVTGNDDLILLPHYNNHSIFLQHPLPVHILSSIVLVANAHSFWKQATKLYLSALLSAILAAKQIYIRSPLPTRTCSTSSVNLEASIHSTNFI